MFADLYADAGLCVGTVQPDGWDIYDYCAKKGTQLITGYLPAEILKQFSGRNGKTVFWQK
jgi:hypothetical protein